MEWYSKLRSLLFLLDPERAHDWVLAGLPYCPYWLFPDKKFQATTVMGLPFPNPVGLAAGFDKNGDCIAGLAKWGFGFIEVGTVTPLPQAGNPKPRLFRLPADQAIINRMGFNNKGVDYLVEKIRHRAYSGILGVNIGKNAITPIEKAHEDYLMCFEKVYPYADYITVNISSPNTPGLRRLQEDGLVTLLETLSEARESLVQTVGVRRPFLIKLAPDLSDEALDFCLKACLTYQVDGVIATNTTIERPHLKTLIDENGGLSGAPLKAGANQLLSKIKAQVGDQLALIGVGGILSAQDGREKFALGADLIQVYTGLIYQGPGLVSDLLK